MPGGRSKQQLESTEPQKPMRGWRVLFPVQEIGARPTFLTRAFRRFRKVVWWTITLQIGQKYVEWKLYRPLQAAATLGVASPPVAVRLEASGHAPYRITEESSVDAPSIDMAGALILADLQDSDSAFETLIEKCYISELKAGMTAVDGGANGGRHTRPMAELVGPTGRIHAFEPLPTLAVELRQMFANDAQVSIHEKALAEYEGMATFNYIVDDPALSSMFKRELGWAYPGPKTEELQVATTMLDNLAGEPVRFMKLDLEGYDYYALVGARALLSQQRPIVALEFGRCDAATPAGYGPDEFFGFFAEVGYQILDLYGRPFDPADFQLPWDARHMPYYVVAAPFERTDVAPRLRKEAWALLQTAGVKAAFGGGSV